MFARIAGKFVRVLGKLARSLACCRFCITCESLCDELTRPPTFDVEIDHDLFFRSVTGCDYDTGTGQSPYAGGPFETQWLGAVDGICRWYYCSDDPCNPGLKYVISPFMLLPDVVHCTLFYGVNSADCTPANVAAALEAADYLGIDTFRLNGFASSLDCCTLDEALPFETFTGASHVTLTGPTGFRLRITATNCTPA